jgi:hypothetical protein
MACNLEKRYNLLQFKIRQEEQQNYRVHLFLLLNDGCKKCTGLLKQQTTKILDAVLTSHHINVAKTLPYASAYA